MDADARLPTLALRVRVSGQTTGSQINPADWRRTTYTLPDVNKSTFRSLDKD